MHGTRQAIAPAPHATSLLRLFTCGSVDDGKSTLIGRLLYDTNSVFEDQLQELDRDSRRFGTQGDKLDFALLLDGLSAEREQGITIDVAYRYFASGKRAFIVADTPGHEQYTRNMATGASTAELAVILVDVRKGILPQTRRHSFIVSMLGIREIVLAVNKMDLVGFNEQKFGAIEAEYRTMSAGLGFRSIVAIPISARDGDNIATPSPRTRWYSGPCLLTYLETVEPHSSQTGPAAFVMPVQWVNRPNLDFRGYAGTISNGTLHRGDRILVLPGARSTKIARMIAADGERNEAVAGEAITITLTDELDISRGDVLGTEGHHLKPRRELTARVLWMSDAPLEPGRHYIIQMATGIANVRIAALQYQIDVQSFAAQTAQQLSMNQIGLVSMISDKAMLVADYDTNRELGAFILIDRLTNQTAGLGTVDFSAEVAIAPSTSHRQSWILALMPQADGQDPQQRRLFVLRMIAMIGFSATLSLIVYVFSGNLWASLAIMIFDLLARRVLERVVASWVPLISNDENNESGAGI